MEALREMGDLANFRHKTLFNMDNTILSLTSGVSCYNWGSNWSRAAQPLTLSTPAITNRRHS